MNYVGLGPTTTPISIQYKLFLVKGISTLKKSEIWHLFHDIPIWMIWIKHIDRVFNQEQWHNSKVKHIIWDNLIMHAKVAWA